MFKISTLNKISPVGLKRLNSNYEVVSAEVAGSSDGILVRSQDMLTMEFEKNVKCIARAGAGVNNIPLDRCAEEGIVVFNTPGANANAVKELVLGGLFLAARNIPEALLWANALVPQVKEDGSSFDVAKQVEKGKSQFAGTEILGKTISVIGFGAIGRKIAKSCYDLGMSVVAYDPFYSEKEGDSNYKICETIEEALALGDYVTLHLPANDSTKKMFNEKLLSNLKEGAVLLNFSRDKLMNFDDLFVALKNGKISKYVTDFPTDDFSLGNEKNAELLKELKGKYILLPHLGASTEEAEDNCAMMAADETVNFLENGNIINSVNFPRLDMGVKGENARLELITKGIENPLMDLMDLMQEKSLPVQKTMTARREDGICYTLFEILKADGAAVPTEEMFADLDYVIKARVL